MIHYFEESTQIYTKNSHSSENDNRLLPLGHVLYEPVDHAVALTVRRPRPERPQIAVAVEDLGGRRIRVFQWNLGVLLCCHLVMV